MANDGQKKSMVQKALDTVERVGNRLPDPAVIFLILTGIVILVSALCGFLGLSVTYDFLDRTSRKPSGAGQHPVYGHRGGA